MSLRLLNWMGQPQWFKRIALGPTGSTPVLAPLHIKPTAAPSGTAAEGDVYADATQNKLLYYNGSVWRSFGSGENYAATATSNGLTTGTIPDGVNFVTVTSADANNIIVLPTPTVGTRVTLRNGATGYELRTSSPTTVAINGGTGSAAESAIGANVLTTCVCDTATTWVCMDQSTAGTVSATEVAAP